MIVSRASPGDRRLVSVLDGSAETRLHERLQRDVLGVDAGQDLEPSPTAAAARAAADGRDTGWRGRRSARSGR